MNRAKHPTERTAEHISSALLWLSIATERGTLTTAAGMAAVFGLREDWLEKCLVASKASGMAVCSDGHWFLTADGWDRIKGGVE